MSWLCRMGACCGERLLPAAFAPRRRLGLNGSHGCVQFSDTGHSDEIHRSSKAKSQCPCRTAQGRSRRCVCSFLAQRCLQPFSAYAKGKRVENATLSMQSRSTHVPGIVRTTISSGRPDLHWFRDCGVDDGEFSNTESDAEATIREITDNPSFCIATSRPTDQCTFSRRSRASSPTAARPSTSGRPRATSPSCRPPTPSLPRWRRRAGRSARRFPPCVSPTSCSSRTTPRSTSIARRSSRRPGSSSCTCSAGSPTGPTGSSRSSRPARAPARRWCCCPATISRTRSLPRIPPPAPRRISGSGTFCCTAVRPTPEASSPTPHR